MLWITIPIAAVITALMGSAKAEEGIASRYGRESGSVVACGGSLNEDALTAAHRSLPCGSRVRVTNSRPSAKAVDVPIPIIRGSMPHARHDLAIENFGVGLTLDAENADQPAFHARQSMIDQSVVAGHLQFEIHDDSAAGRHRDGLDAFQRRRLSAAQHVDLVEDFADDMEG